jgi:hypothetical protein
VEDVHTAVARSIHGATISLLTTSPRSRSGSAAQSAGLEYLVAVSHAAHQMRQSDFAPDQQLSNDGSAEPMNCL